MSFIPSLALALMLPKTEPPMMYEPHYEPKELICVEYDADLFPAEPVEDWTIPTAENAEAVRELIAERRDEQKAVDIVYLAKTIWGEARGLSRSERAMVAWCILNRVDSSMYPNSVAAVVTQSGQFHGYSASFPATEENLEIASDVYDRWLAEKDGGEVERELPSGYLYFSGDGKHNYFR